MQKLNLLSRSRCYGRAWITIQLFLAGCATQGSIPTVADDSVELLVRNEAVQIIAVSEDQKRSAEYQIFLSNFPRKDVLGMSVGNHRIYIRYELAKLAARRAPYLWLLRQTLAHEIAHETAEHTKQSAAAPLNRGPFLRGVSSADVGLPWNVRFRNYSPEKELEADLKGMEYWQKLGWDCRIWVGILQNFVKQNYAGDIFHPTDKRLQQAQKACVDQQNAKQSAVDTPQSAG